MKNIAFYTRRQAQGCYVLLSALLVFGLIRNQMARLNQAPEQLPPLPSLQWMQAKAPVPASRFFPCIEINRADSANWDSLPGIGPVLSKRIVSYRKRLGGFRSETDLLAVYGLKPEIFQQICPQLYLLRIPSPKSNSPKPVLRSRKNYRTQSPKLKPNPPNLPVDLNQADSTALDALPGIGPKLATRILKYRQILGFYYHPDQLRAVYGMSEENFQRMQPHLAAILPDGHSRADLNTANQWLIARLAFWDKETADHLLVLRKKMGRFDQWAEIESLSDIEKQAIEELKVYFHL